MSASIKLLDWVSYNNKIYIVINDYCENKNKYCLLDEKNSLFGFDTKEAKNAKTIYADKNKVCKLKKSVVPSELIKSFFRLETTPWELAKKNCFPFSLKSKAFKLTYDDLLTFANNLNKSNYYVLNVWKESFIDSKLIFFNTNSNEFYDISYAWKIINHHMQAFDIEEDSPQFIKELVQTIDSNNGKRLRDLELSYEIFNTIFFYLECKWGFTSISEVSYEERRLYRKSLDIIASNVNDINILKKKAYYYYGGNAIVPCDWKKSEEALLNLYTHHQKPYAANSLGYIYYSDRLGKPDYKKAFQYFSYAAKFDIKEAIYKLSDMYRKGHGTAQNGRKAWKLLRILYPRVLRKIMESKFHCKYADVALRIGYCYEDGIGIKQNYHKAHEYYLRAKYAIDQRILNHNRFGDSEVKENIEKALKRISTLDKTGKAIIIDDLPDYKKIINKKIKNVSPQISIIEDDDELALSVSKESEIFSEILDQEINIDTAIIYTSSCGIKDLNFNWTEKLSDLYAERIKSINFNYVELAQTPVNSINSMICKYIKSKKDTNKLSKFTENFLANIEKQLGKASKVWHLSGNNPGREQFFQTYYLSSLDEIFIEFPNHILMLVVGV